MKPARFITLEGGEGAGKSTQAKRLAARLEQRGISCVVTREPGGSPGAEEIRQLLVHGEPGRWDPVTETVLLFAARADHVRHTVRPALEGGDWVICDRFIDSTFAYQSAARGVDPRLVEGLRTLLVGDLKLDLTFILDMPAKAGLARAASRALPLFDSDSVTDESSAARSLTRVSEDRFEHFDIEFHEKLTQAFRDIAARELQRCVLIDAEGTADEVEEKIWSAVTSRFNI